MGYALAHLRTVSLVESLIRPILTRFQINGGYFFEINKKDFFDDVCFGKTRSDALQPPSAGPNCGLGDSLLIVDGVTVANNCDLPGYAVPTALVLNGTGSYITKLPKGGVNRGSPRPVLAL